MNYLDFYDLESYLFDRVNPRFHAQGFLSAFDFFCIIIWKSNRSKSIIAKKLLKHGFSNLDDAVKTLTSELAQQSNPKEKLRYLWDVWGFLLPMASAILTVLYPEDFTVYDIRVCNSINGFHSLTNKTKFESVWHGYQEFKDKVVETELAPKDLSLRDRDRFLWGKSFCEQLTRDIEKGFNHNQS